VVQVDLEPNGRLHVIIELDGTHSEGKKKPMIRSNLYVTLDALQVHH